MVIDRHDEDFEHGRRASDRRRAGRRRVRQLELVLESGSVGVWEWDGDRGVLWSPEMERLAGLAPGTFPGTFEAYLALIHPDDRERVVEAIERGTEVGHHHVEHRLVRPDGSTIWVDGRGAALDHHEDDGDDHAGMVGVAFDITERVARQQALERELPLVQALNDLGTRLHRETSRQAQARMVAEYVREATGARSAAVVSRRSVLHEWAPYAAAGSVSDELVEIAAAVAARPDADDPAVPGGHEAGSDVLAVPIASADDDVLDVVLAADPAGRFEPVQLQLMAGAAAHAATAFANSRFRVATARELRARQEAIEARDEVMRVLQRSLLPPDLPTIPDLDLAATFLPMAEDIGGDFYDVFPLHDQEWGVVLGDVCGKGPQAAVVTGLVRHSVRASAMARHSPTEIIHILNQTMIARTDAERTFCTVACARLTAQRDGAFRLDAAIAGHPPLLVLRADGSIEQHGPTGHLVGIFEDIVVDELSIVLGPGDLCVFYTDGATDVRRDGVEFGTDRLVDVVASCRSMPPAAVVTCIEESVVDYQRGTVADDLAVVAIGVPVARRSGSPP